jgi:RimJ/RimL family protein N-acetyltransferase
MIQFKLNPKDFNYLNTTYNVVPINNQNLSHYYSLIQDSIKYFNIEKKWDGMFTFEDAVSRIQNGMTMYVGLLDIDVFGYVWFREYNNDRFLFNLFVRNKITNKTYTGKEFVSDVINRYEYDKVIHCEVDEWNEKSIRLFKRIGFK